MIDGYLYGCAGGPEAKHCSLRCVDVRTGEIAWEQDFGRMQLTVLGAGNKVIIMEDIGMLRIAEATPDAYVEISSCQLPAERGHKWWTPPVLYKSKLYCRNYYGDLLCIDVSN
jgi:hypothetical protein